MSNSTENGRINLEIKLKENIMSRKKIRIGTNTKMYKTIVQTKQYLETLGTLTADVDRSAVDIFVLPSYTTLETACKAAARAKILLGAQNMGWADEGPFTGEISPIMLEEVGVRIVEIGHSERRHILHEDNGMINRKVKAALRHSFTPLICVGETADEKNSGIQDEVLRTQIKLALQGVTEQAAEKIWVAYEPVWAIGANGSPASPCYAAERHHTIRRTLEELFGKPCADRISILYGGSVNLQNCGPLIGQQDIDGLFIGRSAWDAEQFNAIIRYVLMEKKENKVARLLKETK